MSDLKDGYGGPDDQFEGLGDDQFEGLAPDDDVLLQALQTDDQYSEPGPLYAGPESVDIFAEGIDPSIEAVVEDRYAPVPAETEADLMESIIGEHEVYRQEFRIAAGADHGEFWSDSELDQMARQAADNLYMTPLEKESFEPPLSRGLRSPGFRRMIPVRGPAVHPFWQRIADQKDISVQIQEDFDKEWDKGNYISAITGYLDNLKQSAESIPTREQVVETGEFFYSRGPRKGERKGLSREVEQSTEIGAGIGAGIGGIFGVVKGGLVGGPKGAVIGGLGGTMLGGMLGGGATYFIAASLEEDTVSPFLLRMYSLTEADKLRQAQVNLFGSINASTIDSLVSELASQGIDAQPKIDALNLIATHQLQSIEDDQRAGKIHSHVLVDRFGQLLGQSFLEIMQFGLERPEFRAKLIRDRERVYRRQKPDDLTWMMISALRKSNEDFGSTPEEQEEKKAYVQAQFTKIMDMASYESLPEELRRDRIPLEDFKSLISDNFEMEDLDSNPMLVSSRFFNDAARAVLLDASDEEIQVKLDKVSFGTLSHLDLWHLLKSEDHNVFPDDAKVRKWAQEHQTATRVWGSDATVNMERTLGRMMMTPSRMGDEVYMPESTFAMLMRMTTWAPSAVAELDFTSQGASMRITDSGEWEVANERVVNFLTPASYDRSRNLGVRDFSAGYFARLAAAIRTGNIGMQPAIADIMRAEGMRPGHGNWMLFQYLGLALDFLVPWEKPYMLAAGKIAGATAATPRVLRNSNRMPRGHRSKMFYAQVAPGLYARAKGLQDSDPITVVHNVILEAQRDLHAKGDNTRPYIDAISREQVDEMLRVAGVEPQQIHEANEKLFEAIRQARAVGMQRGLGVVGTPGVAASRQSPGFQRFRQALTDAINKGIILRDQYAHIVAQFERQAAVIANDPTIPEIQTISDFFEAFELTLGRQPGPGARFMEGPAEPGHVHMAPKTETARRLVEAAGVRMVDPANVVSSQKVLDKVLMQSEGGVNVRALNEKIKGEGKYYEQTSVQVDSIKVSADDMRGIDPKLADSSKGPIVIGRDGSIIDGRHRYALALQRGDDVIDVYRPIDAPTPRAPEAPAQRLPEIPTESAAYEGQMQVGRVLFDSKNGLGSVSNNSNVAYLGFVVWMKPRDFIGLNPSRGAEEAAGTVAATRKAIEQGEGVGPPFLIVDLVTEGADAGSFTVRNHEGRGRMMAINEIDPDTPVPVHVFGRRSISRGTDITPEMLEGLVDPSSRVRILADVRVPGGGEIKPDAAWHVPDGPDYDPNYLPTGKVYRSTPRAPEAPAPVFVERGLDGARAFDEIEGDPFVWVFHSTDGATADSFLSGGVRAGDKPQTIGREMAARGEVDYAPGRGASDGLYVGGNTDDIPHSRRFLAIKVRRSELELPPESSALGYDTVGGALISQGAIIRGNVPAQNIVDVGVPGKYPNMTRIRETLAARSTPRAPEAPAQRLPETPEEIKKAFYEMGRIQRAGPESQMVQVRFRDGDQLAPISKLVENVGDLTHRMGDLATGSVRGKLKKTYNYIDTPDETGNFVRGLETAKNDATYHKMLIDQGYRRHVMASEAPYNPIPLKTREKFVRDLEEQMDLYAQEHRTVPVYNEVQRLANDAAIAIGERRYLDAKDALGKLQKYLDEGDDAFRARMGRIEPEFARPAEAAPRAPEAPAGREIPPQMRAETAGARTPDEIAEAGRLWREQGTESPYFQRWFGDSKVVDADGKPLVVAHGGMDIEGEAELLRKAGPGFFRASDRGALGRGIYFTPDFGRARGYAMEFRSPDPEVGAAVTDVYLNIRNPLILKGEGHPVIEAFVRLGKDRDTATRMVERIEGEHGYIGKELQREAKKQGYDGIIQYDRAGENISEIVAFEPTQIKSRSNRGTFEPTDKRVRYMRGPGKVPMGFFEWNPQTGRFIINLYRNADMNVLWHENGHLLATIMGRRWSSKLFKFFDHTVDGQGSVKLTSRGHEELAEAWRMYRKVRDSRHGPVRRLFDQLWLEVRNLYYSLRGQPGALPRQAIRIWDLEFGPDPRIVAYSVEVAKQVTKKKRNRVTIDADKANQIREEAPRTYGAVRERRRGRLDPETVRQALGLKFETFVDTMPDGTRIPRRRLMEQDVDALDIYEKALAFVLTEKIRTDLGTQKIFRPTPRTMIPEGRSNRVLQSVRDRMIQAFGMNAKELTKQFFTRKYHREVGFVWREMSELGDHITQADVDALADRMRIQTGNKFDPDAVHNIELIVLKDEQAAGFHTLVHEMAAEPMGNKIPDGMLDPDTSFRLVERGEFERVHEVLIDVEAGVGARASRRIESIPDTLITRLMNGFSAAAEKGATWVPFLKAHTDKVKKFFEIPTFGKDYFDDGVRDIFESAMRRLGTLDQWVLSTQRRLKGEDPSLSAKVGFNQNGFVALVTDLRRQLTPIIDPGQIRSLYDIHKALNDILETMDVIARAKLVRGETLVGLDPDVGGVSVQYIYTKIDRIQALLGDWYGMTPNERIAVNTVRQYKLRTPDSLTEVELYNLADSIQTIKMGIDVKFRAVDAKGRKIWRMMGGDADQARASKLSHPEVWDIYKMFYNGDFTGLWAKAARAGLRGFDVNKPSLFDPNKAFLEMVVRMRAEEIMEQLGRDLAEYGLNGELRSLSNFKKVGDDATFDRDLFGQRVEHHINEIINWRDRDLMEAEGAWEFRKSKGKSPKPKYTGKYHAAEKVPGEKWGTVESATKQITDPYDFMAQTVATDMLYKWGFKFGKGEWEFVELSDGTKQLMPQMVARELEDAIDRAAGVGQAAFKGRAWAYNMSPKHNFGVAITGEKPKIKTRVKAATGRVIDLIPELFPLTTRKISTGVTIGYGLVPTLPYYGGVIIGLQFQNYMSRGVIKATWDAARMLPVMAEATAAIGSRAATGGRAGYRPDMVGAVMARMWKDGQWRPEAVPIITPDFRILTADHVAALAQQYGLKSSFIQAETAESLMKKIYEAYPTDAVGKLQQPFKWWQTFKIEAATFIDNYIRLRIFVDELENGRRPNDAARIAKKTAYDYSELSDAEKTVARNVILFYSYFRKNADLFWDTAIKNPERIISQLRLISGSQRTAAQGEEEAIVFPAYAQTRALTPTLNSFYNTQRYKGVNYMAPYLPVPDMLMIPASMYDAMFLQGEMQGRGYRDLVSRLNPLIQWPFVTATSQDIYFNRNLNRGANQVPANIILADHAYTGGMLWDYLDIQYKPVDQISNPVYQEVPGRGIYVARNGKNYWKWKNLNQVVGGGRTAQWLWDLDKMNVGYVEAKNRLAIAYLETTGGGLLQRIGWLDDYRKPEPGIQMGRSQATPRGMPIPEGTDPGSIYYDTAWPRPGMMEPIGQRVPAKFAHLVGLPPADAIAELRVTYADDRVMMSALNDIDTTLLTPPEKSERLMALYGAQDIVDPSALSLRELPAAFGFRPLFQPHQSVAARQILKRQKAMAEKAAHRQQQRNEKTEDR